MKFIDEYTKDDLAKSSTILQCVLSMLEFECNKDHIQPELIGVENNIALISVDPMDSHRMMEICLIVNKNFKRADGKYTCYVSNEDKGLIYCESVPLKNYIQLT